MHLKKNLLIGLILLILTTNCSTITTTSMQPFIKNEGNITSNTIDDFLNHLNSDLFLRSAYEPQNITLRDTAYHKSYHRLNVEWWFFEGIFENGYSIAFFILLVSKGTTFSIDPFSTSVFWITIYKDAELKFFSTIEFPFEDLTASEEYPFMKMTDHENSVFMELDLEKYQNQQWIFNVTFQIENQGTNISSHLTFTGTTKGYAGEMLGGWYGPILPKASVEGNLTLNEETTKLSGLGYLEHGWNIPLPVWEYGWFFGKFVSDSFTVMWGRMMYTRWFEEGRAAILSKDGEGYITINPQNFSFMATNYRYNNGDIIPTTFIFNLSGPGLSINITMETINIHHFTSLAGLSNCWRHHVRVNGQITYQNTTEIIKDQIQIMGIMRFR